MPLQNNIVRKKVKCGNDVYFGYFDVKRNEMGSGLGIEILSWLKCGHKTAVLKEVFGLQIGRQFEMSKFAFKNDINK